MSIELLNKEAQMEPVDNVQPHPANPNVGDYNLIKESLHETGWFGSIIAQRSTGYILVGNHRYVAAKEEGLTELPVIWVDVDDRTATKIMLADNEIAKKAEWDDAKLLEQLVSFDADDFKGTGFHRGQFEDLVSRVGADAVDDDFEFEGDYALNQKAVDMQPDLLREGAAMREIVLALPKDEALVFGEQVLSLMKAWKTTAVREVVQRAVRECYERLPAQDLSETINASQEMQDAGVSSEVKEDGTVAVREDIEL